MISELVPGTVASVEVFADLPDAVGYEAERALVASAVETRRREFGTARECARRALAQLGHAPAAVLKGERGEPLWPTGAVGSLTHCDGYRAAVAAHARDVHALGIDAEPHAPLPAGVLAEVALADERRHLSELSAADDAACWDRLLFSCKEAVYKAWSPLTGRWLGFPDAAVVIDRLAGTFSARLLVPGPVIDDAPLRTLHGRWQVSDALVLAAVTVPVARVGHTLGGPSGTNW